MPIKKVDHTNKQTPEFSIQSVRELMHTCDVHVCISSLTVTYTHTQVGVRTLAGVLFNKPHI